MPGMAIPNWNGGTGNNRDNDIPEGRDTNVQAALLEKKAALEAAAAAKGLEAVFLRSRPNAAGEVVDEYALVKRREVRPGLSNVYLQAMYKQSL